MWPKIDRDEAYSGIVFDFTRMMFGLDGIIHDDTPIIKQLEYLQAKIHQYTDKRPVECLISKMLFSDICKNLASQRRYTSNAFADGIMVVKTDCGLTVKAGSDHDSMEAQFYFQDGERMAITLYTKKSTSRRPPHYTVGGEQVKEETFMEMLKEI